MQIFVKSLEPVLPTAHFQMMMPFFHLQNVMRKVGNIVKDNFF